MVPTIRHSGKGKTMETAKTSMAAGVGQGGKDGWMDGTQSFGAVKTLCMICHYESEVA